MKAIIPTNVQAIRVNANDNSNVVSQFQGKTAYFADMPYQFGANEASTGEKIYTPLTVPPTKSPGNPLGTGIHLHWELPAYFRKGKQSNESEKLVFPPVPNRWLVIRYLSVYDVTTKKYGSISSKSWIVESDYISSAPSEGRDGISRPAISVPLNPEVNGVAQSQPYMYMGRVVDYEAWNPDDSAKFPNNYLPSRKGKDGSSLYLTSVGFVGPHFSSYYPECCSVFGFWDNFADNDTVYNDIKDNNPIQFRATYQVIGWLNDAAQDPLADIVQDVTSQYNNYLNACNAKKVSPTLNPADFFTQIMDQEMKWTYNQAGISYSLNSNKTIKNLNLPTQTLCSGTIQEVVWNMESSPGTTYFLEVPKADRSEPSNNAVWVETSKLAIGNTVQEALSTMLKSELGQHTNDQTVLTNYEYMLDALQAGLLNDLENTPNKLIKLEEELHTSGFGRYDGGKLWEVVSSGHSSDPDGSNREVTLPLDLAEALHNLNVAQKNYDMDRFKLITQRKQLFMDWIRYVKLYTGETTDPNVNRNDLTTFLDTSSGGELHGILNQQQATGLLQYSTDSSGGVISGIKSEPSSSTTARVVWDRYNTLSSAIAAFNTANPTSPFVVQGVSASPFYMPTEPVLVMQSDEVTLPQRQGQNKSVFIRLSPEILSQLNITYQSTNFSQPVSGLDNLPIISSSTPIQVDVQALVGEAYLTTPMIAGVVANALATQDGTDNPAVVNLEGFTTSLMYAQGGLSPLDLGSNPGGIPDPTNNGLFETIRQTGYKPGANPQIQNGSPMSVAITFTNSNDNGWITDAIGWSAQKSYTELASGRIDPFLPLFMIWNVELNPLQRKTTDTNNNPAYSADNLTSFFALDSDAVDYEYLMSDGQAVDFTSSNPVNYSHSALISSNSAGVLVHQINSYMTNHPGDPDFDKLKSIVNKIGNQQFFSQALGSFNVEQILTAPIAQVPVEDLTRGGRDTITTAIQSAAVTNVDDDWYKYGFNSLAPIATGLLAEYNFGPFRSGFAEVHELEIVDVFGQRMNLSTSTPLKNGNLSCAPSYSLAPDSSDTANASKIFLPPRLLTPTRLWFRWISGENFSQTKDKTVNFSELNTHPDTSPVCGWIMPNHLDNSLFFYTADGKAIGSFNVEDQSGTPSLVYRTRAGNTANPGNHLSVDIGEQSQPTVNVHLANFMWYVDGQDAQFLLDLMASIENSSQFLNPANFAQSVSLSVLIGHALALTRVVLGLETQGNLLPLSQADNDSNSPFPYAVTNGIYEYTQRMKFSSADLGTVQFPVRLGDLANMDDGLVGYLIEGTGVNPYIGAPLYSPAATSQMDSGVKLPTSTTIQLTLNVAPIALTLLIDPRADVHATTGILPVSKLGIPKNQYAKAMKNLAVSFASRPVLQMKPALVVPVPMENGYSWSWITQGVPTPTPLKPNAANQRPMYGYSPQTILEGWVKLESEKDK